MSQELEEFNEIFQQLDINLQSKVKVMLTNYQVDKEQFTDKYRTYEFNLGRGRENSASNNISLEKDIIQQIEDELLREGQRQQKKSYGSSGYSTIKSRVGPKETQKAQTNSAIEKPTYNVSSVDIFGSLTLEKKAVKDRLKQKQEEEAAKNPSASKTKTQQAPTDYSQRKSRGQKRVVYNEGVNQIPGIYNEEGTVEVNTYQVPSSYNFLNCTADARTMAL